MRWLIRGLMVLVMFMLPFIPWKRIQRRADEADE